MTRTGPAKPASSAASGLRLAKARAYHKSAQELFALTGEGELVDPVVSQTILAAIAYADALTAKFGGAINQKNHAAVVKLLRHALGGQLPKEQATRLERLISKKDEAQYGTAPIRRADAIKLLADLEKFAAWAELKLTA